VKRPGITLISILIVAAVVAFGVRLYTQYKTKIAGSLTKAITLKEFSFADKNSLDKWDEKVLTQKQTVYSLENLDGKNCVKGVSDDSASTLFFKQRLSCKRDPFLRWKWKAEKFPSRKKKENLTDKGEFDFAAQIYVVFSAKFFLNAKAIQYVWAETLPVGTVATSPYTKNVKLLVLESGAGEDWKEETRDIKADFRELFGQETEKDVDAISFMTDADSTNSTASAYYTDIAFGYLQKDLETVFEKEVGKEIAEGEVVEETKPVSLQEKTPTNIKKQEVKTFGLKV